MMRIAMIGSKGAPATMGGVERHVEELGARLASGGFDVIVYARSWYVQRVVGSERHHRGMRVVVSPSIASKHLDAITHTFFAILHAMRERVDVYHFHGVGPSLLAWIPRVFRPRARVITTFHCIDRKHAKWGRIARAVLAMGEWAACTFPHETITVGTTLQEYCLDRYGSETTYIPNGVHDVVASAASIDADVVLRQCGLEAKRYFLVVSRMVAHKEIHVAIDAFRAVRREHPEFHDVQLAIVGAPSFSDSYSDALHAHAAEDPAIHFLGQRSGAVLDALYVNALALVHASRSEGLPIVVLEAASAGVLPIVSDIPEHCEVVARTGGTLFRTGDAWDCATKLVTVLQSTQGSIDAGADIREAVLREYHWDRVAKLVSSRYQFLVGTIRVPERTPDYVPIRTAI